MKLVPKSIFDHTGREASSMDRPPD